MAKVSLPPGFRFHPTDVELVCYYLKRKIMGKPLRCEAISEIELYKFAPWDLREKSLLQSKDLESYFFCRGNRKYANGLRRNRATDIGYWKTTGKDRSIYHNSQIVATIRTLVFYLGKAPKGDRTNWVMHEYKLVDNKVADSGFLQDAYVICKIFEKSGPGPKNGEQYGAPFEEEESEDDGANVSSALIPPIHDETLNLKHNSPDDALHSQTCAIGNIENYSSECFSVNRLLQEMSENNNNDTSNVQENSGSEIPSSFILHGTVVNENSADRSGVYDDLEDLSTQAELDATDSIYFSSSMEESNLQNALLKLSNQVESETFYDTHSSNNVAEEDIFHCTQLGNNDGSYLEMEDFQFPVGGCCSGLVGPGNLLGDGTFLNLTGTGVPACLSVETSFHGMEVPSGSTVGQNLAEFPGTSALQTVQGIGRAKPIQPSARGEPHNLPSEPFNTDEGNPHARLQYLFNSVPSRPAIAAEYPSALKEKKPGGGISYYTSSIHVKAEVTLQYPCTEDNHVNASDGFLCASSAKWMPNRKSARSYRSPDDRFVFLFFLGVVSALSWIFLLALGAKLGKCAWKLFFS